MKYRGSFVEKFCYKHPNFGIRNLMKYIIILNVVFYLISMMDTQGTFMWYLYFVPQRIIRGEIWRLVTFMFIPTSGDLFSFVIMQYFYYTIGRILESQWGSAKFTLYYIFGVLCTAGYALIAGLLSDSFYIWYYTNAAFVNLSLYFAMAMLFPDMRVLLFFIIPVKMKWMAWLSAAYSAYCVFIYPGVTKLLPVVAMVGFFIFFAGDIFGALRRASKKPGQYRNAAKYKKKVYQANQKREREPLYIKRCAVCGKTDTEFPDMEFRFCSQCDGYHCYCSEHINSHIHIKDSNS